MARLIFENPTDEQLKHIYKAEDELSKAGVTFDVGESLDEGKILSRDWELDWSLKGARLVEKPLEKTKRRRVSFTIRAKAREGEPKPKPKRVSFIARR